MRVASKVGRLLVLLIAVDAHADGARTTEWSRFTKPTVGPAVTLLIRPSCQKRSALSSQRYVSRVPLGNWAGPMQYDPPEAAAHGSPST